MNRNSPKLRAICRALFVGGAAASPVMLYAAGFPTLGGALLLSSVLVFAVMVAKSRALATSWLAHETLGTIGNATRFELSKAFICAALAVDALVGGVGAIGRYWPGPHELSITLVLTTTGLLAIGAGLFLTRWFAGYLFSRR